MLERTYRASLSVRVPRGAAGDVAGGVREVVEGADGVARAEVEQLRGVRPDALDLYVDADVAVDFDHDEAVEAPAEHLRAGFGVLEVTVDAPQR